MRYGSVADGVVRVSDQIAEVLDLPYGDLGEALAAGLGAAELAAAAALQSIPLADVAPLVPVRPRRVWATGLSYSDHLAEVSKDTGTDEAGAHPPLFVKAPTRVSGPGDSIVLPALAPDNIDFEGEIALVIGLRAKDVPLAAGWNYVFGITAANDVSARDVQFGRFSDGQQNPTLGKSFDSFLPLGPWVTPTEALRDRDDIGLRTLVDGEVRQSSRSSLLIYPVPLLVSFVSSFTTLEPGDVLLTGTPSGVAMTDGRFLRSGQVVEIEVEGVGTLANRVITEADAGRTPVAATPVNGAAAGTVQEEGAR